MLDRPEIERPWWQRRIVAMASSRPGAAVFRQVAHRIDRPLLQLSGGRLSLSSAYPVLLLTTIGAKSSKRRTVPLLYVRRGQDLAVIGTRFGSTHHPGWSYNLRAHPEAAVQIRGAEQRYRARKATEDEHADVWARAVEMYSGYARYEPRARRRIPVFILTPTVAETT